MDSDSDEVAIARRRRATQAKPLPPEVRTALGSRLKALREDRQLSLNDVASRIGVSRGTLGDLERGVVLNPPLGTILRLMVALEVPSIELMFGDLEWTSGRLAQLTQRAVNGHEP